MPGELEDVLKKLIYLNVEETDDHRAKMIKMAEENRKKMDEDQKKKQNGSNI